MISVDDAERASEFIRDNSAKLGTLKSNLVQLEFNIKIVEAREMLKAEGGIELRRSHARASEDYAIACNGYASASGMYDELRQLIVAAQSRIDIWRSENANRRLG